MNKHDAELVEALRVASGNEDDSEDNSDSEVAHLMERAMNRITGLILDLKDAKTSAEYASGREDEALDAKASAENQVENVRRDLQVLIEWALDAGADALDVRGRLESSSTDEIIRSMALARVSP